MLKFARRIQITTNYVDDVQKALGMFHLFNNVYLDSFENYSTEKDYILISSFETRHPVSKRLNVEFDKVQSFDMHLKNHHGQSIQHFWAMLLSKKNSFRIFCNNLLFHELQIQFWKSLYPKCSSSDIYKIYLFFYNDHKIKNHLHEIQLQIEPRDALYFFCDESTFSEFFKKLEVIESISSMYKGQISFEYLLGHFSLNSGTHYKQDFIDRIAKLAWISWFNDFNAIRSDIMSSIYDLKKIYPKTNLHPVIGSNFYAQLLDDPETAWIFDPKFNINNLNFVKSKYSADLICNLTKKINEVWGYSFNRFNKNDEPIAFDQLLFTELLYNEKYLEILNRDIAKGFGCLFVSEGLSHKANTFLACYIYDCIRNQTLDQISFLKLEEP